jgi:hypothetical protein
MAPSITEFRTTIWALKTRIGWSLMTVLVLLHKFLLPHTFRIMVPQPQSWVKHSLIVCEGQIENVLSDIFTTFYVFYCSSSFHYLRCNVLMLT